VLSVAFRMNAVGRTAEVGFPDAITVERLLQGRSPQTWSAPSHSL
jgi:hypothetical protein